LRDPAEASQQHSVMFAVILDPGIVPCEHRSLPGITRVTIDGIEDSRRDQG